MDLAVRLRLALLTHEPEVDANDPPSLSEALQWVKLRMCYPERRTHKAIVEAAAAHADPDAFIADCYAWVQAYSDAVQSAKAEEASAVLRTPVYSKRHLRLLVLEGKLERHPWAQFVAWWLSHYRSGSLAPDGVEIRTPTYTITYSPASGEATVQGRTFSGDLRGLRECIRALEPRRGALLTDFDRGVCAMYAHLLWYGHGGIDGALVVCEPDDSDAMRNALRYTISELYPMKDEVAELTQRVGEMDKYFEQTRGAEYAEELAAGIYYWLRTLRLVLAKHAGTGLVYRTPVRSRAHLQLLTHVGRHPWAALVQWWLNRIDGYGFDYGTQTLHAGDLQIRPLSDGRVEAVFGARGAMVYPLYDDHRPQHVADIQRSVLASGAGDGAYVYDTTTVLPSFMRCHPHVDRAIQQVCAGLPSPLGEEEDLSVEAFVFQAQACRVPWVHLEVLVVLTDAPIRLVRSPVFMQTAIAPPKPTAVVQRLLVWYATSRRMVFWDRVRYSTTSVVHHRIGGDADLARDLCKAGLIPTTAVEYARLPVPESPVASALYLSVLEDPSLPRAAPDAHAFDAIGAQYALHRAQLPPTAELAPRAPVLNVRDAAMMTEDGLMWRYHTRRGWRPTQAGA